MALAILTLDGIENDSVRFGVDTGTNPWFQIRVGRGVKESVGVRFVDDVVTSTPLSRNPSAGNLIDSRTSALLSLTGLERGRKYAQLFSFKTPEGRAPSFSELLELGGGAQLVPDPPADFELPSSVMSVAASIVASPRSVRCKTGIEVLARQQSLEELLGVVAKAAVPLIANLIKGQATPATGPASASAASPASAGTATSGDELVRLLSQLVAQLTGSATSQQQSLATAGRDFNRFSRSASMNVSRAFVAGIDDAAMLAFIGPLIDGIAKVLPGVVGPIAQNAPAFLKELNQQYPMLINAINQRQMQAKAADNRMATDMLSELNRRMMLRDLLGAQQAPAGVPGSTLTPELLTQLLQLLHPVPPATNTPADQAAQPGPAATNPAATGQSLSKNFSMQISAVPSARAVLKFEPGPENLWNGANRSLYARGRALQFIVRLNVAPPVPTTPLRKAIFRIVVKEGASKITVVEKVFKLKDVAANTPLPFTLSADEAAPLPSDRVLSVYGELRWLTTAGRESVAVGTTEVVMVDRFFLKQQGGATGAEREPRDMSRFRTFWNKVWEAPLVDLSDSPGAGAKRALWELEAMLRYSVLLSSEHDTNGVMETRLLKEPNDPEDISDRTHGRLKGGIELAIASLNELLPLWEGEAPLPPEQLRALNTASVALRNASELITQVRLSGKSGQRGILWALPTFQLVEFTLAEATTVDEGGRVTEVGDRVVRFPMPTAVRLIGLRSERH